MTGVIASAPGKAVLLGEYAVLHGHRGLSLAVDRRASVELHACEADACAVEALQLDPDPVRFRLIPDGGIEWHRQSGDRAGFSRTGGLLEHFVAHASRRFGPLEPFRVRIDSGELFAATLSGPVKLGLGSSAAVAVALDAAVTAHASGRMAREHPDEVLRRLLPVYRGTQRGLGSGIDLATSLNGGLIEYRSESAGASVVARRMPASLKLLFVWVGEAASTVDLVAAWRQAGRHHPEQRAHVLARMAELCEQGLAALRAGDGAALAARLGAYGSILGTMDNSLGVPVVTPGHRRAMTLARQAGTHYKPCGAGGGDLGVAVASDGQAIERLAGLLAEEGLECIPLAQDDRGVTVTRL